MMCREGVECLLVFGGVDGWLCVWCSVEGREGGREVGGCCMSVA